MNRGMPVERSAVLGRVLADAERAAWAGDACRARRLLRLADRLAPAHERAEVLVAAESVRSATAAERHTAAGTDQRDVDPAVRIPRLRPLQEQLVVRSPPALVEVRAGPFPSPTVVSRRRPHGAPMRRIVGCGAALLVLAGAIAGRSQAARLALAVGQPAIAASVLSNVHSAEQIVLRAGAHVAAGDTAAAVRDYVAAAQAAKRDGGVAWEAGAALGRIPGEEKSSAEAYLRSYVLGVPPSRWDAIAIALDRVGRFDEAERVRSGVGR